MKNICFYFQIHQPFRLKRYRFFDIGNDHYYYDDFANDDIITRIAEHSYMPMADTLLHMIEQSGRTFKCTISITGTAVEQLQQYVPEFIDKLKALVATGCVEILSETYSHSLASLKDADEFIRQVKSHDRLVKNIFGKKPAVFRNTELIYDDDIASLVASMGFKGMITEGAKHILGWKSPDFVYNAATAPSLKLLLKNDKLSDDISRNFNNHEWSEYPLTADKYIDWIAALPEEQQIVNIFLSMETFGEFLPGSTGIFDFLKALPRFAAERQIAFITPSEACARMKSVGELSVPYPMSWADEARDVSAWMGNDLQREALDKLYAVAERVHLATDRRLKQDWEYLQSSDHFFYMSTKHMADGAAHASFSPYDSPYSAFTNYMNVLADFLVRVKEQYPMEVENEELNSLLLTIRNQAQEIDMLHKEVKQLRADRSDTDKEPESPSEAKAKAPVRSRKSPEKSRGTGKKKISSKD